MVCSKAATFCIATAAALCLTGCDSKGSDSGSDAKASLGDRLVLEVHYGQQYQDLPLTATEASSMGWNVSEQCTEGFGRRAQAAHFQKLWNDDKHGALHLWFDHQGAIMGYGVSAMTGVAAPWRSVDDHFELDFLMRDPLSACGEGDALQNGTVGDRLLMVTNDSVPVRIPMTLQGAFDDKYNDGGPCFPDMGWHMMYDRFEVSTPTPVYAHAEGFLLGMNLNSYSAQERPSFEYPAPKEGKAVDGWHVYFRDHVGACDGMPEATDPSKLPGPADLEPAPENAGGFTCTPYFGNLWVQTLTTVVDVHADGSICGSDKECQFVHYIGPNKHTGFATNCVPPSPTEGCHCYHQVTYTYECKEEIMSSNASGTVDTSGAFNSDGVLQVCADKVVSHSIVGWAPGAKGLESCACEEATSVQV